MRAPVTKILLMIDESGSFDSCYGSTRNGFNQFRKVVDQCEGEVTVDLWFFGSRVRQVGVDLKPADLLPIAKGGRYDGHKAEEDYGYMKRGNSGGTALNYCLMDAIEHRLTSLEMEAAVLAVLITDGGNNEHGRGLRGPGERYDPEEIAKQIQLLRNSGQWTFAGFVPPGAAQRGLPGFTDIVEFQNTPDDTKKIWTMICDRVGDYLDARQGGKLPDHLL